MQNGRPAVVLLPCPESVFGQEEEEGEKEMERARRKEGEGEGEKMGYKSGREWETKLRYTSDLNRI